MTSPRLVALLAALLVAACTTGSDLAPIDADTSEGGPLEVVGIEVQTQGDGQDKADGAPNAPDAGPEEAADPADDATDTAAPADTTAADTQGPADTTADTGNPDLGPALQACEGKSAGDACTIVFPDQQVDGACVVFNGVLACSMAAVPGPADQHEAAVQACAGKAEGAPCSFTFDGQSVTGECDLVIGELQCRKPPTGPGNGIPQEAIDACQGKADEAPCSFTYQGQAVEGACTDVQGQLVCAPGGSNPGGGGSWIPQEAIDACAGQPEGAACSATLYGQTYDGACGDVFGTFACAPDWMGGGNPGGGEPEPDPCEGKAEGDACTATMMGQTYDGTCKTVFGMFTCSPSWTPGG